MANLGSLGQKSIEKDHTVQPPIEELDKLNDRPVPEDDIPPAVLVVFAVIPMAILLILFTFFN
ncbi:hypothetical protein [Clostridium autoethanogenum]|uniref:Uncharacterized protein n=1 Tax=Clostridium autoethanogenum DSM 10061 TaxID=1341692 RepID=A0ABM5NSB8_9CLOT|nr:hypothetical protein [Clostridium autoethanogenum]AGY75300.1 hypothetical protein CAETHG_1075 [Clostridium autoethanogenum DSM 10061]ALU35466.1 Hypothetical protein CLAU_1037 [Clostridium autoethanogenum DSM 10061]OVY48575.1 hypothetical protein WX72_00523 [Clostridium autoethanogenum]